MPCEPGAVYMMVLPAPAIVPAVAFQFTPVLVALATVAVMLWLAEAFSVIEDGDMLTLTAGGGGGGAAAPVLPQAVKLTMQARTNKGRTARRT